jgi:geranylgeranyl diphosphate synthase type II
MMNSSDRKDAIDSYIQSVLTDWQLPEARGISRLQESMGYSLLKGGKRFRPMLSLLIAETFAVHPKKVLPWAAAIEMIHTYSLIHDDLPCMDNDDFRRGEPTNHKVYGETTALLAGDALLTEAFAHISDKYAGEPAIGLSLVSILSKAAGLFGMVGGQAIDLESQKSLASLDELKLMHQMKTGALIRASAEGAAVICCLPADKILFVRKFGEDLGMAFQLKDDLLDSNDEIELGSFPAVLGLAGTSDYLSQVSQSALNSLTLLDITKGPLVDLVEFNLYRTQ